MVFVRRRTQLYDTHYRDLCISHLMVQSILDFVRQNGVYLKKDSKCLIGKILPSRSIQSHSLLICIIRPFLPSRGFQYPSRILNPDFALFFDSPEWMVIWISCRRAQSTASELMFRQLTRVKHLSVFFSLLTSNLTLTPVMFAPLRLIVSRGISLSETLLEI